MRKKIQEFFAERRILALQRKEFGLEEALRTIQDELLAELGLGVKKARGGHRKGTAKKVARKALGPRKGALPDLVLTVLKASTEPLGLKAIEKSLKKRGWKTTSKKPATVIANALFNMKKKGVVTNPSKGLYAAGK